MDNKITKLIVSNKKEKSGLSSIVYVHLSHLFENNKHHFCVTFMSDVWNEGYFLPLSHIKEDGRTSHLNTFELYHKQLGYNLEEIFKEHGMSLYGFLNESYIKRENYEDYKEQFKEKASDLLYIVLGFPIEQTMKILNWAFNSSYTQHINNKILITTFKINKV